MPLWSSYSKDLYQSLELSQLTLEKGQFYEKGTIPGLRIPVVFESFDKIAACYWPDAFSQYLVPHFQLKPKGIIGVQVIKVLTRL